MLASTSSIDPFEVFDESSEEDEVVGTVNEFDSDEDFILIPHAHSHSHSPSSILGGMARLSLASEPVVSETPSPATPTTPTKPKTDPKVCIGMDRRSAGAHSIVNKKKPTLTPVRGRRGRGRKDLAASYPSPLPSPSKELEEEIVFPIKQSKRLSPGADGCFGSRPLIESDAESEPLLTKYEEAASFITSFLSNPSAALSCSPYTRLTFLQSLIIELGLVTPSSSTLPSSLTAAKHFLKKRAFINIGDYLSVRQEGLQKVREIMFDSKKALAMDLRKQKGRRKANKGWVKRHGLNVLLVSVF